MRLQNHNIINLTNSKASTSSFSQCNYAIDSYAALHKFNCASSPCLNYTLPIDAAGMVFPYNHVFDARRQLDPSGLRLERLVEFGISELGIRILPPGVEVGMPRRGSRRRHCRWRRGNPHAATQLRTKSQD